MEHKTHLNSYRRGTTSVCRIIFLRHSVWGHFVRGTFCLGTLYPGHYTRGQYVLAFVDRPYTNPSPSGVFPGWRQHPGVRDPSGGCLLRMRCPSRSKIRKQKETDVTQVTSALAMWYGTYTQQPIYRVGQKRGLLCFATCNFKNIEKIYINIGINQSHFVFNIKSLFIWINFTK